MTLRRMLPILIGVCAVTPSAVVRAAGEAHAEHAVHGASHGIAGMLTASFLATAFGFVAAVGLVAWLMHRQVAEALSARRERVLKELDEAKAAYEGAKAAYEAYAERLEHLDEELIRLREEMIRVGEAERDRIVAEAERRAARLRAEAEQAVERRAVQLRQQLRREAAELALRATEEALREGLGAGEQERLARDYLAALGAAGRRGSSPSQGEAVSALEGRP